MKIIIEDFMTTIGLNGNALVLFAILWAESKHGEQTLVDDYQHYADAMCVTVPTYYNTMKKLMERGLVKKGVTGILEIHKEC